MTENIISAEDYSRFVRDLADPGMHNCYLRFRLLKAATGIVAEVREWINEAHDPSSQFFHSEAGDIQFWLTEFAIAFRELTSFSPLALRDLEIYSADDLLELTEKAVRSPRFNPEQYYEELGHVFVCLAVDFSKTLTEYGIDSNLLRDDNYRKLMKRHDFIPTS